MLDDLGGPSAALLARTLQVHPRTAARWIKRDQAPHAVMLAIFWLTRWGTSAVDAHAVNAARMHAGMSMCLAGEVLKLRRELARVVSIGDFGCANQPLVDPAASPLTMPARAEVIPLKVAGRRPTAA